ncbi:DUF2142 domain-containing protein [Candidatus Solirubrobacter pratensis]|uniref:DUF2142 domain-containing protein n=1 Tax=Candidatus Solirubrobacter pratensis TaxID=1298857 RepID=UPI000481142E|nr:DUF2142 domain-containing protein [Candidatus Solirubrobacter pratensis]
MIAALLLGLTWVLVTPAFQAPDENAHFGYVQSLVESGDLPGDVAKPPYSSEQEAAMTVSNSNQTAAVLATKMEWSRRTWERWLDRGDPSFGHAGRADTGGPNPAAFNPPLYYVYDSLAYRATSSGNLFSRLTAMRMLSVLWLLVTVAAAWLLAGEIFNRDKLLGLAAAGLAAFAPMVSFVSASVSPDAMLLATWTVALWLGVRILRRGITAANAAVFFAVVGAATIVKATSFALLPGALLVLAIGLHRRRPLPLQRAARLAGAAAGALVVTAGAWFAVAHALSRPAAAQVSSASTTAGTSIRELFSYVWQYYLPRIPGQNDFPTAAHTLPAYDIWFKGVWASFGWTEVVFRNRVYIVLLALTLVVIVAASSELWRTRTTADRAIGAFLALVTLSLLAGLHWSDYRIIKGGGSFNQGRYLLPLIGVAGLVLALAVRRLAPARRPLAVAGVFGGLMLLQVLSIALMVQRYYA